MRLQRVAKDYKIRLSIFHLSGADGLRLLGKEEFPFVHLSWILLRHLVPIFCGLAGSVVHVKMHRNRCYLWDSHQPRWALPWASQFFSCISSPENWSKLMILWTKGFPIYNLHFYISRSRLLKFINPPHAKRTNRPCVDVDIITSPVHVAGRHCCDYRWRFLLPSNTFHILKQR